MSGAKAAAASAGKAPPSSYRPEVERRRPRVAVTRAPEQADEVCDLLRAAGMEPVCLPVIAPHPLEETPELDAAIARLEDYDWIVFASANAYRYFIARLRALGRPPAVLRPVRLACGAATAALLASDGLEAALVPAPFSAEAAVAALAPHITPGTRILLPRAASGREALAQGLRALGALVDEAVLYRTEESDDCGAQLARLLQEGALDAITFFSPSAVQGFARAAARAGLAGERVAALLERVTLACIGHTTARAVETAGWHPDVIAPDTTASALVAALAEHLGASGEARPARRELWVAGEERAAAPALAEAAMADERRSEEQWQAGSL